MSKKQLLIHMDDMGMDYAANEAGKRIFTEGIGTSASIIMQATWAKEFADWWKENPQYDVGIHFAQTSEWEVARWRPLCGEDECPTLYDEDGFFYRGMDEASAYRGSFEDYKKEVDKQVELAARWGFKPTHYDSHMIVDWRDDDRFEYYIGKAVEDGMYICINDGMLWNDRRKEFAAKMVAAHKNIICDGKPLDFHMDYDYEDGVKRFVEAVGKMDEGLYKYTIHPIIETDSIKKIIPSWQQRVNEANLMLDPRAREAVEKYEVELVGYKDLGRI